MSNVYFILCILPISKDKYHRKYGWSKDLKNAEHVSFEKQYNIILFKYK